MAEFDGHNDTTDNPSIEELFVKKVPPCAKTPEPTQSADEPQKGKCKKDNRKYNLNLIIEIVLIAAVVVLFLLHFCDGKAGNRENIKGMAVATASTGQPGTGEILFINLDTIQEHYIYFQKKKAELEATLSKQEASFSKRRQDFQKKYTQFQQNVQAGVLTEIQIQNAHQQLENEYQKLEADATSAEQKINEQSVGINQIMLDSLKSSGSRISAARNASYVFTYSEDMPILICTDPTKDITDQVLKNMNQPFEENK